MSGRTIALGIIGACVIGLTTLTFCIDPPNPSTNSQEKQFKDAETDTDDLHPNMGEYNGPTTMMTLKSMIANHGPPPYIDKELSDKVNLLLQHSGFIQPTQFNPIPVENEETHTEPQNTEPQNTEPKDTETETFVNEANTPSNEGEDDELLNECYDSIPMNNAKKHRALAWLFPTSKTTSKTT